jgi:hypothetical protein
MSNLTPRINRFESNLIIDGAMEMWPEGTSRTISSGSALYGSVLMYAENDATSVSVTNSRQADVPSGTTLQFSNRLSKTAAGTLASNTSVRLRYNIEGYDIATIRNQEFSLIFWVKSSVASSRTISLRNTGSTHSFLKQYNINTANTWELKAVRFSALSACPGTLDLTNGTGISISFGVVLGTNLRNSTTNSWVTGNFLSGIGEDTTWLTGTNHDFSIAGVMVLPGNWEGLTAAQYNFVRAGKNFEDELAMSQRYFELVPGTTTNTRPQYFHYHYKTIKRATPVVGLFSGSLGGADLAGSPHPEWSFRCPNAIVGGSATDWLVSADARF